MKELEELKKAVKNANKRIEELEKESVESWDLPDNVDFIDYFGDEYGIVFNNDKSFLSIHADCVCVGRVGHSKPINKQDYKIVRTTLNEITSKDVVYATNHDNLDFTHKGSWCKYETKNKYWFIGYNNDILNYDEEHEHYFKIVKR